MLTLLSVFCSNRNLPSLSVNTARLLSRTRALRTGWSVTALITRPVTESGAPEEAINVPGPGLGPVWAPQVAWRPRKIQTRVRNAGIEPLRRARQTIRCGD